MGPTGKRRVQLRRGRGPDGCLGGEKGQKAERDWEQERGDTVKLRPTGLSCGRQASRIPKRGVSKMLTPSTRQGQSDTYQPAGYPQLRDISLLVLHGEVITRWGMIAGNSSVRPQCSLRTTS